MLTAVQILDNYTKLITAEKYEEAAGIFAEKAKRFSS